MKRQLAGANGQRMALGVAGGEPEPGRTAAPTVPVDRPARLPTRVVRTARVSVHIVGGLATTVLVFPWIAPPQRQALIRRWSRQLLQMLGVEALVRGARVRRRTEPAGFILARDRRARDQGRAARDASGAGAGVPSP